MADNVFSEGVEGGDPDAGLPNVMDLVSQLVTEVQKDVGGFLLAGLPPTILLMGGVMASLVVVYGSMFLGMMPGLMGDDEDLAAIGAMSALSLSLLVVIGALVLVTTPMWASLYRSVWAFLVRGEKLTVSSSFSAMGQDLGAQFAYLLLSGAIVTLGVTLCYVPGLVAQAMLMFAWPAIVIHRMPVGRAISWSVGHSMAHPAWHLGLWAVNLVMSMVLPYIPFLGYLLLFTVHPLFVLMAYRAVAGDGEVARDA
jgi:hypothetical protein